MGRKRCTACGDGFSPCRHVPDQRYCSKPACQRERRRRWQRDKLQQDHRANQAAAQRRWRARHPDYWRNYRQRHSDYTARNREQQRERNQRRGRGGTRPLPAPIANMDAYLVKIQFISETYSDKQ